MKESIPENKSRLNQLAKKALQKVKESPDPSLMYALQLAQWSLESGKLEADLQLRDNLESFLYLWEPKQVQELLEQNDLGDEVDPLSLVDDPNDPVSLAAGVLENLHSALSARLPGYPRPRELPMNFR